jgi:site-specific recombinase XerD
MVLPSAKPLPINDTLREAMKGLIRRLDVPWVFYEVVKKQDKEIVKRFVDIKRSFNTACKKAGIQDFVFHSLRHTFASHLVMGGVDLTTVSRLLGHKSLTMTLRYSHLAPNHLTSAVSVLNSSMSVRLNHPALKQLNGA